MSKGPDAFRTISEVAEELDLPQHVLRFWETRFTQIRPMKRGGGRRYYRPDDVDLLRGIRKLLYGEGYTIKGVQRILKEQGARHVVAAGVGGGLDPAPPGHRFEPEFEGEVPEGILVDERDAPRKRSADAGGLFDQRREPVFSPRRDAEDVEPRFPAHDTRIRHEFGGHGAEIEAPRREPVPDFAPRIPAAPPAEHETAEVYIPPQAVGVAREATHHASSMPLPEWDDAADWPADARHAVQPRFPVQEFATPQLQDEGYPSQHEIAGGARGHAISGATPQSEDGARSRPTLLPGEQILSRDEIDRLKGVLVDLLECKRILDQAR